MACQLCEEEAQWYYLYRDERAVPLCNDCKDILQQEQMGERYAGKGNFIPIQEYDPKIYVKRRK
jgi:NAD-dependent SIR2 family protein deacetylase